MYNFKAGDRVIFEAEGCKIHATIVDPELIKDEWNSYRIEVIYDNGSVGFNGETFINGKVYEPIVDYVRLETKLDKVLK